MIEALKDRLDADKIKKAFEIRHDNLPAILVRPGDTWERTQEISRRRRSNPHVSQEQV